MGRLGVISFSAILMESSEWTPGENIHITRDMGTGHIMFLEVFWTVVTKAVIRWALSTVGQYEQC